MSLAELKKELHASIEETNDEQLLLEVTQILGQRSMNEQPDLSYEHTAEFQKEMNESIKQADNGEVYSYEDSMNWLNDRAWRTK